MFFDALFFDALDDEDDSLYPPGGSGALLSPTPRREIAP
jgi:hypothetical protein